MESDPADSEDGPPFQAILDVLDDADCRQILRQTGDPMTASELVDTLDVPRSTLYRKLDLLSEASLLREGVTITAEGGRRTYYRRDFSDVTISIDDEDEFDVAVERPPESPEDRLVTIWSEMGEEL